MKCKLCGGEAYIAAFDEDDAICDKCENKAYNKANKMKEKDIWKDRSFIPNPAIMSCFLTKVFRIFRWCPTRNHTPPYRNGWYCYETDELWSEIKPVEWQPYDENHFIKSQSKRIQKLERALNIAIENLEYADERNHGIHYAHHPKELSKICFFSDVLDKITAALEKEDK